MIVSTMVPTAALHATLRPARQLFSGKFYSCNDATVPDHAACTGTFVDPDSGLVGGWMAIGAAHMLGPLGFTFSTCCARCI